jgi:hypothetical protein
VPTVLKSVIVFSTIIIMLSYINYRQTFNSFMSPNKRNQKKLTTLNTLAVLLVRNFEVVTVSLKNSKSKHLEVVAYIHKAQFVEDITLMQSSRLEQ